MARRSLATLFSAPRAVTLAGRPFLVEELTVGALAEVHRAREAGRPDPLEGVADLLAAPSVAPADRGRIADAYDRAAGLAEGEDPGDEAEDPAATATREAFALLGVALRAHHPEMDDEETMALLYAMSAEDHRALQCAAFRPAPLAVLMHAIDRLAGTLPDTDGDEVGPDWHEWVDRVARGLGVSYAAVREMTLTQFFVALCEGKSPEGRDARPGEDAMATVRKWQAWFDGEAT